METYQELNKIVKEQLKGHYVVLFIILIVSSLALTSGKDMLTAGMDIQSSNYQIVSFVYSLLGVLVNNTVLFIFIKRVRQQQFQMKDVTFSISMVIFQFLAGILLSLIQLVLQMAVSFLSVFPPAYYLGAGLINTLFLLWSALIAYGIYDADRNMMDLISGSFSLMRSNYKLVAKAALPFALWYIASQLALIMVVMNALPELSSIGSIFMVAQAAQEVSLTSMFLLVGVYLIVYIVQFVLMIPLYLFIANLYQRNKETFYPNAKR